jgi:hypothetical protein
MLSASVVAAILTAILPSLEPWSERAWLVLLIGLLGYAGTAGVYAWPSRQAPEVRQMRRLRDAMAWQLAERRRAQGGGQNPALVEILAESVERLDRDMLPAIAELVAHNQALRKSLERFTRGELVAPDRETLSRLEAIEARQRDAVAATRQKVANAYGATLAIAQQSAADLSVVAEVQRWSRQLRDTQEALSELLDESASWEHRLETGSP